MLDGNLKETDADKEVRDRAYSGVSYELRQFAERFESRDADKRQASLDQAEIMAEAKARGYSTKALREVIKLRKVRADVLAEHEAIVAMYRLALGM